MQYESERQSSTVNRNINDATVNSSVCECEQIHPTSKVLLKLEGLSLGMLRRQFSPLGNRNVNILST